jgi:hypothetical protein
MKDIRQRISAATKGWLEYSSCNDALMGKNNSITKLTVIPENGIAVDVQSYHSMTINEWMSINHAKKKIKPIKEGIYYVNRRHYRFSSERFDSRASKVQSDPI